MRYSNSRPSTLFFRHAWQKRASGKREKREGRSAREPPNYRQSVVREGADNSTTSRIFIAIDDRIKDAPGEELASVDCMTKRMRAEYNEAPRRGGCGERKRLNTRL